MFPWFSDVDFVGLGVERESCPKLLPQLQTRQVDQLSTPKAKISE